MNNLVLRTALWRLVLMLCITGYSYRGYGQCIITELNGNDIEIEDFRTVGLKLIVRDQVNGDLSDTSQGICGVRIQFSHTQVSDVRMELIAPDGTSLGLIGPALLNGTIASLPFIPINHNISFVPSTETVAPDAGAPDVWSNLYTDWATRGNYTGSYYPTEGHLDISFASGPIDGIWELRVTDDFLNDKGIIEAFQLIFCDPANAECIQCKADAGTYTDPILSCIGEDLEDIEWKINSSSKPSEYSLFYVLDSAGVNVRIVDDYDFSNLPEGGYSITAISVLNTDMDAIVNEIDNGISLDTLDRSLSGQYCFDFTETPLNLSISSPDTISIIASFCREGPTFYNGIEITNADTILTELNTDCSTFNVISFDTLDMKSILEEDSILIFCNQSSISLTGSASIIPPASNWQWYYEGVALTGSGSSMTGSGTVIPEVFSFGTYSFEVSNSGCVSRDSIEVVSQIASVDYSLEGDAIIDCNDPVATINFVEQGIVATSMWTGPGITSSTVNAESILVDAPGLYSVRYRDTFGCTGLMDTFRVLADTMNPEFTIVSEEIRCDNDGADVLVLSDDLEVKANWYLGDDVLLDAPVYNAQISDTLFIEVYSANGCIVDTSIFIQLDTAGISVRDSSYLIDCQRRMINIVPDVSISPVSYQWFDVEGVISTNDFISTDEASIYSLVVTRSNGCTDTAFYEVMVDTLLPQFTVAFDEEINCIRDSARLDVFLEDDAIIEWQFSGFDNPELPRQVVFVEGEYSAVITDPSSLCTEMISLIVSSDRVEPEFEIVTEDIRCDNDGAEISLLSMDQGISANWYLDDDVALDMSAYNATISDTLFIEVYSANGCIVDTSIFVQLDTAGISVKDSSYLIDCQMRSIDIVPEVSSIPESYEWFDEEGIFSTDELVSTDKATMYSLIVTRSNGCTDTAYYNVSVDTLSPQYSVVFDDEINCIQDSAVFNVTLEDDTFIEWQNPDIVDPGLPRQVVFREGVYDAIITDPSSKCTESISISISSDLDDPVVDIETEDITCDDPVGSFSLTTDRPANVLLVINRQDPISTVRYETSDPAEIVYSVTALNGCNVTDTAFITALDILPQILIPEELSVDCTQPSNDISVTLNTQQGLVDYYAVSEKGDTIRNAVLDLFTDPNVDTFFIESYVFYGIGSNGCIAIDTLPIVYDFQYPDHNLIIQEGTYCNDITLELNNNRITTDDFVTATWNVIDEAAVFETDESTILSGDGIFILELRDSQNGCSSMDSFDLAFTTEPFQPYQFAIMDETCFGDEDGAILGLIIRGGEGDIVTTFDSDTSDVTDLNALAPGTYTISTVDELSCTVDTTVVIEAGNAVSLELGENVTLFQNEEVDIRPEITSDADLTTLIWMLNGQSFDITDPIFTIDSDTEDGWLSLFIADERGCSASDSILVEIASKVSDLFYIPNALNPTSNMGNDRLYASFSERIVQVNSFSIFNRWGELVHREMNLPSGENIPLWDGRISGVRATSGVYVYHLDMTLSNGLQRQAAGDITVVH